MEIILSAVILILIGVVVFLYIRSEQERQRFAEERQDLYNRMMAAGNPIEYGILKDTQKKPAVVSPYSTQMRRKKTLIEELQEDK